jgi:hypothetical protein
VLDVQVWLSGTPKLRRWMGPKTLHKLRGESKQMQTTMHESSVEVPKNDILKDKLGLYSEQIGGMADAYEWALERLCDRRTSAAGVQGTALGTTYDGQNLIDTDHTYPRPAARAQSNKVTGAFSATTYNRPGTRISDSRRERQADEPRRRTAMMLLVARSCEPEVVRDGPRAGRSSLLGESNMDKGTARSVLVPWIKPARQRARPDRHADRPRVVPHAGEQRGDHRAARSRARVHVGRGRRVRVPHG